MARPVKFSEIPYVRPDMERIEADCASLIIAIEQADGPGLIDAVRRWNQLVCNQLTTNYLNRIHVRQNMNDAAAREEESFLIQVAPRFNEWDARVKTMLTTHTHRDAIVETYGDAVLRVLESEATAFDPAIGEHLREEARLKLEYERIQTSSRIEFLGETYPLTQLRKFDHDADRQVRHAAARARDRFLLQHAGQFDRIFDELVRLRNDMARTLGYPSYVEFTYQRRACISYGPRDIASFRDEVLRHLVPCAAELRARQAASLEVDELMPWDRDVLDRNGSPKPLGDVHFLVDQVGRMSDKLPPEVQAFYRLMTDHELFDLEAREGKASGGTTYFLHDYQLPFIFLNLNGSRMDVWMLMHEIGHALQKFCCRKDPLVDYIWPTKDVAEIHSLGFEFLTFPWMDLFFGEDADRYRLAQIMEKFFVIPHICQVDEFQEFVYTHPDCGPEARCERWLALEAKYEPGSGHGDLEAWRRGRSWQNIRLIYQIPFYHVDYALGSTCALQLWERSERDYDAAFADYLKLCRLGGRESYPELLRQVGLRSPFEPGVLEGVVELTRTWADRTGYGKHVRASGE